MAEDLYHQGFKVGRRWAGNCLQDLDKRGQLILLNKVRVREAGPHWFEFFEPGEWVSSPSERLFDCMNPDESGETAAYEEFVETVFGVDNQKVNDPFYLRGFAEGALLVWDDVEHDL